MSKRFIKSLFLVLQSLYPYLKKTTMRFPFNRCFRKREPEMKPGAILDQVISESSANENKCLLYQLADYKKGGELIDAINIGGLVEVEKLIREQFGVFMYNEGEGKLINRPEFLRWKFRDVTEVMIPIEDSLSVHDPLGKWVDHKACWQMQYRGALGESLLHVLIICDSKIHTKLSRVLLRVFPKLAMDVMEGEEYLGASALHLAIAYSNNELVADLIEAGADINQRAIGSFFLPRDQQRSRPSKTTDYEGLAYMGEYPLAWSACCTNESVYNLLLDHGADPDAQDSFGNMILHMVVVCDKLDMFGYALRHPKTPAKNGIANHSGLTPLTLACKLGRAEVFREMLELSSREFWRYSNITCSGYPLNALDTLLPDGRTNWNSALFIILNGTKEEHLDMLDGGIIQRLLEEKWKTFARNQFLKRLLILFIHLFFLSISVYLRPVRTDLASEDADPNDPDENGGIEQSADAQNIVRYCAEVATIAGVLSYVIFQQGDEVKNQGLSAFLKQLSHAPAKAIFLFSNLLILACIPFRIMGDIDTEEAILVFAVPGSWFLLMFFAGAVRLTGPFVTMIYSMLTGDMFTFGIIYAIVIFGFSQAFFFLFKGHPQLQTTMFNTFPSTWMALFQTTLGDYNYPDLNQTSYPNLAKTVFVTFMIFVPILLLNMLIAMMGNTYAHVIEQSEKEWMKQWAKIVVTLERAVPQTDAQKYLEAYSIPLGVSDDTGFEQRGVMVIKSKSKTRAKQRKGAVSNWKRVGKVTLNALKKRGMTGEQMRRLMWGRASISSPIKITKKKLKDPYNLNPQPGFENALNVMNFGNESVTTTVIGKSIVSDPLRDLVLHAELADSKDPKFKSRLSKLAAQACALVDGTEKTETKKPVEKSNDPLGVKPLPQPTIPPTITNKQEQIENPELLQNLFQDPKFAVDPVKLEAFYNMLEEIDTEESDNGFVSKPVLGKMSLILHIKEEIEEIEKKGRLIDLFDPEELRRGCWENPFKSKSEAKEQKIEDVREQQSEEVYSIPIEEEPNIIEEPSETEQETGNEEVVTAQDVHRAMAQLHLKRRQFPENEDTRRAKSARIRRKKNKVSPEDDENLHYRQRSAPFGGRDSYQDPLEPWSTRELGDINKILGYK